MVGDEVVAGIDTAEHGAESGAHVATACVDIHTQQTEHLRHESLFVGIVEYGLVVEFANEQGASGIVDAETHQVACGVGVAEILERERHVDDVEPFEPVCGQKSVEIPAIVVVFGAYGGMSGVERPLRLHEIAVVAAAVDVHFGLSSETFAPRLETTAVTRRVVEVEAEQVDLLFAGESVAVLVDHDREDLFDAGLLHRDAADAERLAVVVAQPSDGGIFGISPGGRRLDLSGQVEPNEMPAAAACDSDLLADAVDLRFGAMLSCRRREQRHEIRRSIDVVFEILPENALMDLVDVGEYVDVVCGQPVADKFGGEIVFAAVRDEEIRLRRVDAVSETP